MEKVTMLDYLKQQFIGAVAGLTVMMVLCLFGWGTIIKYEAEFQANITAKYIDNIIRTEIKTDKLVYAQMLSDRKAIGWARPVIEAATNLKELSVATANIKTFEDSLKFNLYDYGDRIESTNEKDAEKVIELYYKKLDKLTNPQ